MLWLTTPLCAVHVFRYLYNNKLSGSLPEDIGNLARIQYMYVYHPMIASASASSWNRGIDTVDQCLVWHTNR
jgi:hypothetical protein